MQLHKRYWYLITIIKKMIIISKIAGSKKQFCLKINDYE